MADTYCASCGHNSRAEDRFCRACGAPLTDDARADGPVAEAEALVSRGLLTDAIATIQRGLSEAETPELHVALSTLYLRRGDVTDARRALDRALAIDPNCAVAHAYIGGMLIHEGRVEEAQARLDLARDLAPDDLIVLMKRAEFWLRLGILDNARVELRHGLQDGGGSPQTRAMAETMYAAIEKRMRSSFVRKTVTFPSVRGLINLVRRPGSTPAATNEAEA